MARPRAKGNESPDRALSRTAWTDAALRALADGGIEAVKVERLAASLGVTKGSFYWHFTDRGDLRVAALERWEEVATSRIIEHVDGIEPVDPRTRLRALAETVFGADAPAAHLETAIRVWSRTDGDVKEAVDRVDSRRLRYTAGLLRSVGHPPALARRRARLLYRALIGDYLWRTAGGPGSTRAELDDLVDLLAEPQGG